MVLRTLALALLAALCLPFSALAQTDDLTKRHEDMLYTVVLVQAGASSGSGTVVFSDIRGDDYETFVLTNFHVVDTAVKVGEERDPKAQKGGKRERREPVEVL